MDIDDRMKFYEKNYLPERFTPLLPTLARLDGKSFHNFCRNLNRPYDKRLSSLMIDCTKYLVSETNATCGYTQSDEITLSWYSTDFESKIWFDGRISKMISVLAATQSVYFNKQLTLYFTDNNFLNKMPLFDCRVWQVPNIEEGANAYLWREQDATKNAISMAARTYYSHNEVENKNGSQLQELLWQKGINFNDYPDFFKRGTFIQRKKALRKFTTQEFNDLPPKHQARQNPKLLFERTDYVVLDMPPFSKVNNRAEVIFFGADPITLA